MIIFYPRKGMTWRNKGIEGAMVLRSLLLWWTRLNYDVTYLEFKDLHDEVLPNEGRHSAWVLFHYKNTKKP